MITVQNSSWVILGTASGELAFTNEGSHQVSGVLYVDSVRGRTDTSGLRDGAVVSVDQGGFVGVQNGPDVVWAGGVGFGLAVGACGVFLAVRWVVGVFMRGAGISVPGAD